VLGDSTTNAHRDLIISLAAQHRLPAVYWHRFFVTAGGLMSYGVDFVHEFGQVAFYIDRILRGAKPADLPVQAATKFENSSQPQDGKGARPARAAWPARGRRRGD
jgi:putative ABC transport system substrate-binding protein